MGKYTVRVTCEYMFEIEAPNDDEAGIIACERDYEIDQLHGFERLGMKTTGLFVEKSNL